MKLTRKQVYKRIDSEREFQDRLVRKTISPGPRPTSSYLILIKEYLDRATKAWTDNLGDEETLDIIRKISGITVACMEEHGAPYR